MPDSLGILRHLFPVHGPPEHRIAALGSTAPKGHGRVSHFAMSTISIYLLLTYMRVLRILLVTRFLDADTLPT